MCIITVVKVMQVVRFMRSVRVMRVMRVISVIVWLHVAARGPIVVVRVPQRCWAIRFARVSRLSTVSRFLAGSAAGQSGQ